MPALYHHLAATPVHDLRAIASRLGVASRTLHRKPDFIQAILTAWADPTRRSALLATLSPAAQGALTHLQRVAQTPAALFFAEYGALRHARTQEDGAAAPWRSPATVTEELYYAALLGAADLKPLRAALYLCTPDDLFLTPEDLPALPAPASLAAASLAAAAPAWTTAYDLAQWLALLYEQTLAGTPAYPSPGALWPRPHLLQQLNRRLAAPAPEPLPRAPSQINRLRLLLFLADAAGLQQQGVVTPLGWSWLGEPPEQQTALLWRAWCDASPLLRQRYAFADGLLPAPWPAPLLAALAAAPAGLTAGRLAEHLLDRAGLPAQYWVHQVASLHDLHRLVARTLQQVCIPFGLITAQRSRRGVLYPLTPLGAFLLGVAAQTPPAWQPAPSPPTLEQSAHVWQLSLPPAWPLHAQLELAPYAAHTGASGAPPAIVQHYTLDDATLARAVAAGFQAPGLAHALARSGVMLNEPAAAQLTARLAQIPVVSLRTQTLLHTAQPADLHALLEKPALRPLLDDLLSATTATLKLPPAEVQRRLLAAGYAVITNEPLDTAPPPDAVLWLAARLYRRLGDFAPLPLPLTTAQIDGLLAGLTPTQRGALAAADARVDALLLDLLDGQIFAPPDFTADTEEDRRRLESAAARHQSLTLDYFSPGRNLLTRRPVTPLWIEEANGHTYLRAECHLTGRILLFRLDRIKAIGESGE